VWRNPYFFRREKKTFLELKKNTKPSQKLRKGTAYKTLSKI
jgi:hypothetical protein